MRRLRLSRLAILPAPPEHRSPGWRRRSATVLLAFVLVGACGYSYLTREGRLTAIARDLLEDLSGGQVDIQRVHFSFFSGLHVTNLVVRAPSDAGSAAAGDAGRIVFQAADVWLRHRPLSLLLGRFDVERLVAIRPEFRFVTNKTTGRSNWTALMDRPRRSRGGGEHMALPRVELKQCMLRCGVLDGARLELAEPLRLDLAAVPAEGPGRVYDCVLQPAGVDRLLRHLKVDLETGAVSGDLPDMGIALFRQSLPAQYARWCEILELAGQVGADSIEFKPEQRARCAINLSRVMLSVPFDESEFDGAEVRARRMVRLREATGRIVFEPAEVRVDIRGQLNGEPVRVWGRMTGYNGPFKAMGYDLRIDLRKMAIPDCRDPYVVRQIGLLGPRALKIYHDFEPTAGWVSFQGRINRPEGEGARAKLRGEMKIFDAAGRYDDFPYPGQHIRSTICFTDEGLVFDVLAHQGRAMFEVKGWSADGSSHSDADVTVEAVSVPLDDELYAALPPKLKSLWRHFELYGLFSCKFRLQRYGGTPEGGAAPWKWSMRMDLHDVAARYEAFNFMQWGLNGAIEAADGLISRIDLWAARLGSLARITGTADLRDEHTSVDLRVTAKNRPLTPDLIPALPERVRDMVRDSAVKGLFDLDASVKLSEQTNNELLCRATVDWHDGSVQPKQWPYPLGDVHGRFCMDQASRRIEMRELTGRNGPAAVRLSGTEDLKEGGAIGRFQAAADDLPLDERLYRVLPPSVQRWWQAFEPKGRLGARSDLTYRQTPGVGETAFAHRTTLLLAGIEACWDSFPLPLRDLNGKIVLTDGRCEVQDLTALHGTGQVRLDGALEWDDAGSRARLKISAKDMPLDDPLRLAVPWQVRRLWSTWQPAGQIDVDLTSLRYVKPAGGGATWDLEGSLAGRLQKLDMSIDVTDAVARTTLAAHIDEARGTFESKGRLEAERAVLSLILVTDARAEWVREADGTLRVRDVQAKALGGELSGFLELDPTARGDRYGVVLSLDHGDPSQLAEILTHGQMSGVSGMIQTQMRLRGLVGQPDTRSGAAEVQLAGKGLYRLPVLLQLANVLNIPVVSEPREMQNLTTKMTIVADQALVDSLELRDSLFLMLGNGAIDIPTRKANLTIIAAQPRTWPKIPVLTELVEGAVRELVEVHASGPLNDLKFEARPLRSLQAALQILSTRKHPVEKVKVPKMAE
jgi:hypothetical protein